MATTKTKKTNGRSSSMKSSDSNTVKSGASNGRSAQPDEETQSALQELFHAEIKDIYWAEKHLVKALPKMRAAASSVELQEAIETHLAQTKEHVVRLEQVFEMLEEKPQAKKCEAMEGLVEEGEEIIDDTEDGSATRDVGIILAAQKVEHYEIAAYGGLTQLAKTLGHPEIADLLAKTLAEEKEADVLLTGIAENDINYQATTEVVE